MSFFSFIAQVVLRPQRPSKITLYLHLIKSLLLLNATLIPSWSCTEEAFRCEKAWIPGLCTGLRNCTLRWLHQKQTLETTNSLLHLATTRALHHQMLFSIQNDLHFLSITTAVQVLSKGGTGQWQSFAPVASPGRRKL